MSEGYRIRIIIADDHNMVRKGLVVLLEEFDDIEVIGEAGDGEYALDFCKGQCPDVVLMDMIMPRMDGIEATKRIREACPETQVIALTSFSDEKNVEAALKAGAIGYLMKNISGDELATAIRRAAEGQTTLAPEAAQVLIKATTRPPAIGHDLTARELDVLALMIEGLNNREIGERLIISSSTVKNHVSNILSKLDTTSRTQAVALAVEHKIIE
ncbi:MAG: response regulator transcription factor [Aggregatilineales bacterium]